MIENNNIENKTQPEPTLNNPEHRRQPEWVTLDEVDRQFTAAGIVRTRALLARYCRQGRLIGAKDAGPNGDEWYVDPASIPRAIAELTRIHGKDELPEPTQTDPDQVRPGQTDADQAGPGRTKPDRPSTSQNDPNRAPDQPEPTQTDPDQYRPGQTRSDYEIYEHPFVKRLEADVEYWKKEYKSQVKITQDIQQTSFDKLVELQRMVQVGQSKTLADFFIKTKDWLLGAGAPTIDNLNDLDEEEGSAKKRS